MQSIWSTMAFLWSFCYVVVEDVKLFLLHHQEEIVRLHIFMEIRITSTQWNLKDIWQSTDTLSKCMVVWVVCISLSKIWTPTGGVVGRLFYKKEKWFKDMKTKNNNKKIKRQKEMTKRHISQLFHGGGRVRSREAHREREMLFHLSAASHCTNF